MIILDFINKYIVVINSVILIILLFRYLQDLRRYRLDYKKLSLEHEKLKLELERLREEMQKNERLVVEASPEQLDNYVLKPLAEGIEKATRQLISRVESFDKSQLYASRELGQIPDQIAYANEKIVFYLKEILETTQDINRVISKLQELKLQISLDKDT